MSHSYSPNSNEVAPSVSANFEDDLEGPDGEHRLMPYVLIGGPDQYGMSGSSQVSASEISSPFTPIKRFTLAVSPLQDTGVSFPNSGGDNWMINLDNEQLYTPGSADYGKPWSGENLPATDNPDNYCGGYWENDGAYTTPVPVQGLPIEFRKVYFRGEPVDGSGKTIGCTGTGTASGGSGCNTYYAYFACSLPVEQDCDLSGCNLNPRNENFGIMDGVVTDWDSFDIGCGGGGGGGSGCENVYSSVSGINSYPGGPPVNLVSTSGCTGMLVFETTGCSGFEVSVSGSGNASIITFALPESACSGSGCENVYSSVSGINSYPGGPPVNLVSTSGCTGMLVFETTGCSGFEVSVSGSGNASIITFTLPESACSGSGSGCENVYSSVSGINSYPGGPSVGSASASGCTSTLVFETTGCSGFEVGVSGNGTASVVTFTFPESACSGSVVSGCENVYGSVSGINSYPGGPSVGSASASGCTSTLVFETTGCSGFEVGVTDNGNASIVTFTLPESACSGSVVSGCENVYGSVSGINSYPGGPSVGSASASGCTSTLVFETTGCSGFEVGVTDNGNASIVTFTLPESACSGSVVSGCEDVYSSVSGINSYPGAPSVGSTSASGCTSMLVFETTGCNGFNVDVVDADLKYPELSNASLVTFTLPESACSGSVVSGCENVYGSVSGINSYPGGPSVGSASASGCTSTLVFETTGCSGFEVGVTDNGNASIVTFTLPESACSAGGCEDVYSSVSGINSYPGGPPAGSASASGCTSALVFETTGCSGFEVGVADNGNASVVTFTLPESACEPAGGCENGISGVTAIDRYDSPTSFDVSGCDGTLVFKALGCDAGFGVGLTSDPETNTATITYNVDAEALFACAGYEAIEIEYQRCTGLYTGCCTITVLGKNKHCDDPGIPTSTSSTTYNPSL